MNYKIITLYKGITIDYFRKEFDWLVAQGVDPHDIVREWNDSHRDKWPEKVYLVPVEEEPKGEDGITLDKVCFCNLCTSQREKEKREKENK